MPHRVSDFFPNNSTCPFNDDIETTAQVHMKDGGKRYYAILEIPANIGIQEGMTLRIKYHVADIRNE